MNKIVKLIIIIILFSVVIKCENQGVYIQKIFVSYYPAHVDLPIPIGCGQLYFNDSTMAMSTINDREKLNTIQRLINKLDSASSQPENVIDIRIECRIFYTDQKIDTLCFGEFHHTVFNGKLMKDDDSLSYFIKKDIGFYEKYIPKQALRYMPEYLKYHN